MPGFDTSQLRLWNQFRMRRKWRRAPLEIFAAFRSHDAFFLAAGMAAVSLGLALLIPRHPEPGYETLLSRPLPEPAE